MTINSVRLRATLAAAIVAVGLALCGLPAHAQADPDLSVAILAASKGEVFRLDPNSGQWEPIPTGTELFMHDRIRTGPDSGAALLFHDGSEIKLHENSALEIVERPAPEEPKGVAARLRLFVGGMFSRVNPQQSSLEFETPDAVATVRGTEFGIRTRTLGSLPDAQELTLLFEAFKERHATASAWSLLEGLLSVAAFVGDELHEVLLAPNQKTATQTGEPPAPPEELPEEERAEWEELDESLAIDTEEAPPEPVEEDDELSAGPVVDLAPVLTAVEPDSIPVSETSQTIKLRGVRLHNVERLLLRSAPGSDPAPIPESELKAFIDGFLSISFDVIRVSLLLELHALPAGAVEDSLELISEAIGGIFQAAFQGVKLQGVENISQDDLRQIYRNIVEESGVIAARLTEIETEFDEALAKLDTVDFPNQSLPEFIEGVIGNAAASRDDLEFAFNAILQFDSAHGSAEAFPGELELEFRVISDTEGEAVAPGGLPLGEYLLIAVWAGGESNALPFSIKEVRITAVSPRHISLADFVLGNPKIAITGAGAGGLKDVRVRVEPLDSLPGQGSSLEFEAVADDQNTLAFDLDLNDVGVGLFRLEIPDVVWETENLIVVTSDNADSSGRMPGYDLGRSGHFGNRGPLLDPSLKPELRDTPSVELIDDWAVPYSEPRLQGGPPDLVPFDWHASSDPPQELHDLLGDALRIYTLHPELQAVGIKDGTWSTQDAGLRLDAVASGILFAGRNAENTHTRIAWDAATGIQLWQTDSLPGAANRSAVRIGPDRRPELYFPVNPPGGVPGIVALDGWTGKTEREWALPIEAGSELISVHLNGADLFAVALTPEPHLSVHRIDTATGAVLGSHASALGPISGEAHWKLLSNIVLHPSGLYALMVEPLTGGYQLHLIRIDLASLSINHSPLGSAFGEDEDLEDLGHRLTLVSTDEALWGAWNSHLWAIELNEDGELEDPHHWEITTHPQPIYHLVPAPDGLFIVHETGSAVHFLSHAPFLASVDPNLEKRASRSRAQIGDVITYTIVFDNTTQVGTDPIINQPDVWIADRLPAPLRYVRGSALIDPDGPDGPAPWQPAPDPADEDGTLWWELTGPGHGPIGPFTKRSLSYQAVVSAAAIEGVTYVNRAQGFTEDGGERVEITPVASAPVLVAEGFLTSRGALAGRVWSDLDGDGLPGPDEPAMAGVELILESGARIVADSEGRFSLRGLAAGLHVMRIDLSTVPAGYEWRGPETFWVEVREGGAVLLDLPLASIGGEE